MKHARLSPSGAYLDLNCPGNRAAQAEFPDTSSVHSAKGTGLHALGAACLIRGHEPAQYIGWWCGETERGGDFLMKTKPVGIEADVKAFQIDAEDASNVAIYTDYVLGVVEKTKGRLLVEKRVTIDEHTWGTADAQILPAFDVAQVVDYKNGHTYVDANTPQLKLYLIGAIGLDNPNEYIGATATIVQPNCPGAEAVRSVRYGIGELMDWYHKSYRPRADKCLLPNAERVAGPWCKTGWCDARRNCPALTGLANEVTQNMFAVIPAERPKSLPAPVTMTPELRGRILDNMDTVKDWLKEVYNYEYAQAMHGKNTWGKLTKGSKSRDWANAEVAEMRLNVLLRGDIYKKDMLSPAGVEKALKARGLTPKAAEAKIADLVKTSPGKPKLVSIDAKGEAIQPGDSMFNDVSTIPDEDLLAL